MMVNLGNEDFQWNSTLRLEVYHQRIVYKT